MRFIKKFVVIMLLAVAAGLGIFLYLSGDPLYAVQERVAWARFHRYDAMIEQVAAKNKMDPMLLKSVIWRESAFDPKMVGKDGERGLMQVTEGAAEDWSKAEKQENFKPDDLFDPLTNIEAGAWYLKQALQNYETRDDPIPFALAEYNAGRQRVNKWLGENNLEPLTAKQFRENISFPSTQKYVQTILDRRQYYKKRGHL